MSKPRSDRKLVDTSRYHSNDGGGLEWLFLLLVLFLWAATRWNGE